MSVELINNHVLFPHPANWNFLPQWSRRWQSEISDGVTGAESRFALRTQPRQTLSFLISPRNAIEQALLDARMLAAKKSGKACAPFHGRASVLNAECSTDSVVLQSAFWPWAVGDTIFFRQNSLEYETRTLTAVDGVNLTLNAAVDDTYAAGALVWPMFYGKFSAEDLGVVTNQRGAIRVTLSELIAPSSAQVGELEGPVGAGIGVMELEDTFVVA